MCTVRVWNLVDTCFNRYMVECEFVSTWTPPLLLDVLIDTWWNVNYVSFQLYLPRIGF